MQTQDAKLALIETGAWIAQQGWVPATGGNFSIKTETGFVVTASGFDKGNLNPEQFLELSPTGQIQAGTGRPSAETELHLKLYKLCPHARCVLHTHSISATVLSRVVEGNCLHIEGYEMQKSLSGIESHKQALQLPIFDNDQNIAQLAEQVANHHIDLPIHHGVLIRGHGLYAFGRTVQEARRHIEGLEFLFACELERIKLMRSL
ncbi:methylthioribulose 1-phosphate dehydratase [Pseudoalteromonas sp. T1lg65]|uniref:methylthioribulose 1-phosphate dehydratase n=1 Tax=Pseudoalteromonas sp. T1lg65 TaxID=2077101 RepID=UPI003F7A56F0